MILEHEMGKGIFSVAVIAVLSVVLLVEGLPPIEVEMVLSNMIEVPVDFQTIQGAINAANAGDIISVAPGTYYEHVTVNKTLSLIGEKRETTVIDGNRTGVVVTIAASDVVLSGFTIRRSGQSSWTDSGVFLAFDSSGGNIRNNVVTDSYHGVFLEASTDNVLSSNNISSNTGRGIILESSSGNAIYANLISQNEQGSGIELFDCASNRITANNIAASGWAGIYLAESPSNVITANTLFNNSEAGIFLEVSSYNLFYHNSIINNGVNERGQVFSYMSLNTWDNGAEGNYWSDHIGVDVKSGLYQNETGSDGISEIPYNVTATDRDRYPLMEPWSSVRTFPVNGDVVTILSNSTKIADFSFEPSLSQIGFNATGTPGTLGFCNVTIPKTVLNAASPKNWSVSFDGVFLTFMVSQNSSHSSLYFNYAHSSHRIRIRVIEPPQNLPPRADFTYSPIDPTPYDIVNFTDTSIDLDGTITSRDWQFGDGDSSFEENPRHRYAYSGTYIVTLKVRDDQTNETETSKALTVRKLKTTLTVMAPSIVTQGEPVTVTMTLKDERLEVVPNANIGIYLLREKWEYIGLDQTNASGIASITYTSFPDVGVYRFKALFNSTQVLAESSSAFSTEIVRFVDLEPPIAKAGSNQTAYVDTLIFFDASNSTDKVGIVSYQWNFGDGASAEGIKTNHTYITPGKYIVNLTVRDAAGNTATDSIFVTVHARETFPFLPIAAAIIATGTIVAALILWRVQKRVPKESKSNMFHLVRRLTSNNDRSMCALL